ncbi:MAG: aldehyde dehydrogenase [Microbacterium sp.]|nr:aldehyde dehydrogenase [Microbacterium sp.]MDF2578770.1 aldehyde dehydrogenase [Microbacterium sp.]
MIHTVPDGFPTQLFIGGEFVDAIGGETLDTINPTDGSHIAAVAAAGEADVDKAVAAARQAFDSGVWSRLPLPERKAILFRFAELIEQNAEHVAVLDAVEAGKPISDNLEGDLPEIASTVRWYAEAIDKVFGRVSPTTDGALGLIVKEPIGVVGAVVPWNFPVAVLMMKVAPALAAGNSVIVKPPELASLSALKLAEIAHEAGVPAGVLNVVPGRGEVAGRALGLHPDVDVITFTGSTEVGRHFLQYSAESNLKRIVLELGGKSPQIVTASVAGELQKVAEDLAGAAFWNGGQNCTAGSRILVHNSVKADFVQFLSEASSAKKVGDPLDSNTEIGPLIEPSALERVSRYIEEARAAGADVVSGGERIRSRPEGLFYPPTVVTGLGQDSPLWRDEIFGPVTLVRGFDTEDEAIALANDTPYGLAATIWSRDIDQAIRMARGVKAGIVAVNGYSEGDITTPFGGYKLSGFGGKDKGLEAFDQYTETKTIWITVA